ncbi:MAG TPA: hypothetical protein VFW73_12805 [Lacipirellulaceae bacterium]|nr:hypothetical protein [Lacipirellulaceae bacterium]
MKRHARLCIRIVAPVLVAALSVTVTSRATAQSAKVVSIEEHWELQLADPDVDRSAPQTTMVMSPTADLSGTHFLFTLNHVSAPVYAPGGMQVQLWNGEEFVEQSAGHVTTALEHSNETVRWTQRISLDNGTLHFQVLDGTSETWSSFGGDDLSLSVASSLTSLNSYHPSVSIAESQVSYAENRVVSLTLTKLIWTTDDGVVHEQDAPIPIDISLGD